MVLHYAADALPLRREDHVERDTTAGLYDVRKIGTDYDRLQRITATDARPGVPLGDGALFVLHLLIGQRRPGD
eukprot:8954727-Karenia_brevis.AAC.1